MKLIMALLALTTPICNTDGMKTIEEHTFIIPAMGYVQVVEGYSVKVFRTHPSSTYENILYALKPLFSPWCDPTLPIFHYDHFEYQGNPRHIIRDVLAPRLFSELK